MTKYLNLSTCIHKINCYLTKDTDVYFFFNSKELYITFRGTKSRTDFLADLKQSVYNHKFDLKVNIKLILTLFKFKKVPFTRNYDNYDSVDSLEIFRELIDEPKKQVTQIIERAQQVTQTIKRKLSISKEPGNQIKNIL